MNPELPDFPVRLEADFNLPWLDDHLLEASLDDCLRAAEGVRAVTVSQHQVSLAAQRLAGNVEITLAAAVAYPLGGLPAEIKVIQAEAALEAGAGRIDLQASIEYLKAGLLEAVREQAQAVAALCTGASAGLLLMADFALLSRDERRALAEIAASLGAGLHVGLSLGAPARAEDLRQLRVEFGFAGELVAGGDFSLYADVAGLVQAGADRVCTPRPFEVLRGYRALRQHGFQEA